MRAEARQDDFRTAIGRAFLIAVERRDREAATVFAKALLTRLPPPQPG